MSRYSCLLIEWPDSVPAETVNRLTDSWGRKIRDAELVSAVSMQGVGADPEPAAAAPSGQGVVSTVESSGETRMVAEREGWARLGSNH